MSRLILALVVATFALLAAPATSRAGEDHVVEVKPIEIEGIEIADKRGTKIPIDSMLTNQDGKSVRLGDYFDGTHPVLLVMAYYQCPMLCSMVLNGVDTAMKGLKWSPGVDYRVVTISFDTRDTVAKAKSKREVYLSDFGRPVVERGWDFLVGDQATVRAIANSVGFAYRWDESDNQFAHAAGLFVMTPLGVVSNVIQGISFPVPTVRLALTEASSGRLGSAWDQILLLCYHYDPLAKSYVLAATRLMRAGGLATVTILAAVLARLFRAERRAAALAAATA
ncbi:MAG: SCO family protein [Polyangiales bacterium]